MAHETVVLTGAAGGLGQAISRRLLDSGMSVIGIDRVATTATGRYEHLEFDLRKLAASDQARDELAGRLVEAKRVLGCATVTALVNNAALQVVQPARDLPVREFRDTFDVNVTAPFALARMLHADLYESRGAVVNVSSIHAQLTKVGFSAYSSSKAALTALSRALALEWGDRIRVTCIEPAAIATPMLEAGFAARPQQRAALDLAHPSGCIGTSESVADWVVRLIGDRDPYSNGMLVRIDGGIRGKLYDPASE